MKHASENVFAPLIRKNRELQTYSTPAINTYSEADIIEAIGPANTCGSVTLGSPPFGNAYGYRHGRGHKH